MRRACFLWYGDAGSLSCYVSDSISMAPFALSTDKTDSMIGIRAADSCSLHSSIINRSWRIAHKEENLAHEKRRHWDSREFDEYIVLTEGRSCYYQTPEQWVCRKETILEIKAALALCTEAQRRRFLLYALDGLSYAEIAGLCRCSKAAIQDSIEAVRKKIKKFF